MSYNPGVQDISGQLRAQGVMAKARGRADMVGGIGDGMLQGYEIYTANKQKNAALSGANEAMLKPFLSDPEFQKYAPEGIEKFLTKREKEGGLSLKDNIQLSGMLTAAAASRKMVTEQQMAQSDMAARAQEQQANAMKIAAMQRQQAAQAKAADDLRPLAQLQRGEGFNVLRPEVLAAQAGRLRQPGTQVQLEALANTGQTLNAEDLTNAVTQREQIGATRARISPPREFPSMEALQAELPRDKWDYKVGFGPNGRVFVSDVNPRGPMQPVPEVPNTMTEKIHSDFSKQRVEQVMPAMNALTNFVRIDEILNDPESGGFISGVFAKPELFLKSAANAAGGNFKDAKNTQELGALMAAQVVQIVKGLGSGTAISDADRKFAERAAGGDITMDEAAIKRIIAMGRTAAQYVVDDYESRLDEVFAEDSPNPSDKRARSSLRLPGRARSSSKPSAPAEKAPPQSQVSQPSPATGPASFGSFRDLPAGAQKSGAPITEKPGSRAEAILKRHGL